MSTLSVPPVPTNPRDDAIQLYRAFKGGYPLLIFSLYFHFLFFANFQNVFLLEKKEEVMYKSIAL